jgi:peptidoglycan/xylan/chitin deacetylase (PgdA/CDA1 family)
MNDYIKTLMKWLLSSVITRSKRTDSIYLTFDDGPHPSNTEKLLSTLLKHDTKATFFMVGKQIDLYPEIAKKIFDQGHTLGYHSYDHRHAKDSGFRHALSDLDYASKLEDKYGISFNKLYRPPYGALTLLTLIAVLMKGWKVILWSKDSMDSYNNSDHICKILHPEKTTEGDIILFHDDYDNTSNTIDLILDMYKSSNIKCSEL